MEGSRHVAQEAAEIAVSADGLSVVEFYAPWCAQCERMKEQLSALAQELGPAVTFRRVNADEHPALAERYNVITLPAVLVFSRGRLVDRTVGNKTNQVLFDLIADHMENGK